MTVTARVVYKAKRLFSVLRMLLVSMRCLRLEHVSACSRNFCRDWTVDNLRIFLTAFLKVPPPKCKERRNTSDEICNIYRQSRRGVFLGLAYMVL